MRRLISRGLAWLLLACGVSLRGLRPFTGDPFLNATFRVAGARALALCLLVAHTSAATIPVSKAEDPNYDPEAADARPARLRGRDTAKDDPSLEPVRAPEPELPRFEGETLRAQVPDLVVTPWPPPPRLLIGFNAIYPLQVAGVGIGVEGYPADFLRLSIYYGAGVSGVGQFLTFSHYGQARVGVRLFSFRGSFVRTAATRSSVPGAEGRPMFKAVLPATHAVLLETGVMSGGVPRLKCVADCTPLSQTTSKFAVVNPQLFYPMAGLRYVFNTDASSKLQPLVNRSLQLEIDADMLFEPLNDSKESLYWGDLSHVHSGQLGGMGGVEFRICGRHCVWLRAMGGYLPGPASPLVGVGIGG